MRLGRRGMMRAHTFGLSPSLRVAISLILVPWMPLSVRVAKAAALLLSEMTLKCIPSTERLPAPPDSPVYCRRLPDDVVRNALRTSGLPRVATTCPESDVRRFSVGSDVAFKIDHATTTLDVVAVRALPLVCGRRHMGTAHRERDVVTMIMRMRKRLWCQWRSGVDLVRV